MPVATSKTISKRRARLPASGFGKEWRRWEIWGRMQSTAAAARREIEEDGSQRIRTY